MEKNIKRLKSDKRVAIKQVRKTATKDYHKKHFNPEPIDGVQKVLYKNELIPFTEKMKNKLDRYYKKGDVKSIKANSRFNVAVAKYQRKKGNTGINE